jgi:hypothetical protein
MIPTFLLRHTATITPKTGVSGHGPTFGEPFDVACLVEDINRLVIGPDGSEVVSSSTLRCDTFETPLKPGSKVTFAGSTKIVISVSSFTAPGLPTPDHMEVALQ